jgi:hypothetical protein
LRPGLTDKPIRDIARVLLAAAAPAAQSQPRITIVPGLIAELLSVAAAHGVLPLCIQHLGRQGIALDPEAERLRFAEVALTLALSAEGERLLAALEAAGLDVRLIKGAAFAKALYQGETRSFTDIDLLLRREDFPAAGRVLAAQGYRPLGFTLKHARGYAEEKWERAPDGPLGPLLVELHWDLIGSPTLRRGRRCDLALLRTAAPAEEQAQHLLVAAVHGALGDGFTRLQPLADLARALAAPVDLAWLAERMRRGRLEKPLALALDLAQRCFVLRSADELRRRLGLRRPPYWVRRLLSVPLVASPDPTRAGFRRQMVREWLKLRR